MDCKIDMAKTIRELLDNVFCVPGRQKILDTRNFFSCLDDES